MRYLVTGAAGFLGFALAKRLAIQPDARVTCVDNFVRGENDADYRVLCKKPNVQRIDLDLTEQSAVRTLPDVDVVYHMAALNGTQNFYERPFEVVRCCTLPTLFLVERYADRNLKRFIYAGTSEAYASTVTQFNWPVPTDETVPLAFADVTNARWSYGASKMHGEIAVIQGCGSRGAPWSVIRFHNAYGPRMGDKHVVPDFLNRAKTGRYELFGFEDTRAFIYVDDAVRGTIAIGETPACAGEIVNLGGGREIDMLTLGRTIMQVCDMQGEIVCHPSPAGSVRRRAPDVAKLRRLTGFQEEWSLEAGLAETAKYYLR